MSIGIVACGALATEIAKIQSENNFDFVIYPLPPLLHNHPEKIAGEVDNVLATITKTHEKCFVAYADCGTYGALDTVIAKHNVNRLGGNHCYDVYASQRVVEKFMAEDAGTYFLTDFLVKSFYRSVMVELGLDKRPDLRDDYFKNYHRVIWLTQSPTDELTTLAKSAAELINLPLEIHNVGLAGLAHELKELISS